MVGKQVQHHKVEHNDSYTLRVVAAYAADEI
jgi:hypothetical protein